MSMILSISVTGLLTGSILLAAVAAWTDWRGLRIPNAVPASLCLLFGGAVILQEFFLGKAVFYDSLAHPLLAGLAVFTVTAILFALRLLGAGDAKLLSALALWTGIHGLAPLLFWMACFGGILALVAILIKKHKPFSVASSFYIPTGGWIDQLQNGRNAVPYGVAIFVGLVLAYAQMGHLYQIGQF